MADTAENHLEAAEAYASNVKECMDEHRPGEAIVHAAMAQAHATMALVAINLRNENR